MPDLALRPLVVTAQLAGPVAYHPHESISLDGPLLYHVLLYELGDAFFDALPHEAIAEATARPHPDVPLATWTEWENPGWWVYCASLAEPVGAHGTETLHWHSHFDETLAHQVLERDGLDIARKATVDTLSGEFRSNRRPLYVEHVEALRWYVVGDMDGLERALTGVRHLGKKRMAGNGAVASWAVERWDGDGNRWLTRVPIAVPASPRFAGLADPAMAPARAIPARWLAGDLLTGDRPRACRVAGMRPPYWLPEHQVMCIGPWS